MTKIKVKSSTHIEDLAADGFNICYAEVCDDCGRLTINNSSFVLREFAWDNEDEICDGHCHQSEVTNIDVWFNLVDLSDIPC